MEERHIINKGLLVIKASAGSGKTYTLTKLYIEQLLFCAGADGRLELRHRPNYHKHILAITFTNKATDEMKSRIVKELYKLAKDAKQSDYYEYFAQRCTPEALNGMQQAAGDALMSILFNYSEFTVSTIDSFFQSILRCFARELDRDYNYEIQIDADFAVMAAVHSFLLSLGHDMARTAGKKNATTVESWVKAFIKNNVAQGERWNLYSSSNLIDFAKQINAETFRSRMEEMRAYLSSTTHDGTRITDLSRIQDFQQMLIKASNYYQERYRNDFNGAMRNLLTKHGIDESKLNKRSPLYSFLLQDKMQSPDEKPTEALRAITASNLSQKFKDKYEPSAQAAADIMQLVHDVVTTYDRWQLLNKMARNVGLLGLLGVIDEKLEQYRKDTNTILIADTNELIGRIVGRNKGRNGKRIEGKDLKDVVPFIYERVGTKVNHYMIDEFQDTSLNQYENFMPLLYESLSHSHDNFNMIIGDAKQSIYRFRNADPSIFRDYINEDFTDDGLVNDTLETNYRSTPAVIDFNNSLFKAIIENYAPKGSDSFAAKLLRKTYMPNDDDNDYQQKKHIKDPEGLVRIVATDGQGEPLYSAKQVLDMLPDYLLELHKRYDWKHIGILVSKNDEGTDVVARILSHNLTADADHIIRITSDESMLLSNSVAVRRIISMLRFIDLVQYKISEEDATGIDDDVMASATNKRRLNDQRMFRALSEFIAQMAQEERDPQKTAGDILNECLEKTALDTDMTPTQVMDFYADQLLKLLPDPRTKMLTLTSIIEHVTGVIMDDAMRKETTFIMALQDCIATFEAQSAGGTVREFLRYWDQRKDKLTVASASTDDAIRIMTIHKSKGLEFECVVLPFVNWLINSPSRSEKLYWMPREQWTAQAGIETLFTQVPGLVYDPSCLPPLLPLPRAQATQVCDNEGFFASFLDHIAGDRLIDNLNKTYVAFTRPREEMHMFTILPKPNKSKSASASSEAIGQLVARLTGAIGKQSENAQVRNVELGHPRTIHKRIDDQEKAKKKDKGKAIEVNEAMPAYFVTGGSPAMQVKLPHDTTIQQNEGIRLHNLLSRIDYQADAERALQFGLKRGIIEEKGNWNLQQVKALLDHLFSNPVTAQWYAADNAVYTERSIASAHVKTTRPDRVVRRPDGTMIVIDYKFGEQRKKDHDQVADYAENIMLMGHSKVQAFLLYLQPDQPPRIVRVR